MSSRQLRKKARRSRRPTEEDLPLSLLALLNNESPGTKRKATRATTRKRKVTRVTQVASPAPVDVITLEDSRLATAMVNNINEKIGNFMQSGSFISSDEDETEMIKVKTNKKASPDQFFISDDSDDDCSMVKVVNTKSNTSSCEPSTSAGTSGDASIDRNLREIDEEFIDKIIHSTRDSNREVNKQSSLQDMKSIEDFRKETEEILKKTSSLLDEIKTGRKVQPELEDSPPKVTVGACPICLESLASRPASVTVCGHIFCKECITQTAKTLKKCPSCRKSVSLKKIHPIYF